MNRETYDALVASVEKWRKNATLPARDGAVKARDCPLCLRFWSCMGCPVRQATGMTGCDGTPWRNAAITRLDVLYAGVSETHWQAAAQREADFLAALVPAGGPDE